MAPTPQWIIRALPDPHHTTRSLSVDDGAHIEPMTSNSDPSIQPPAVVEPAPTGGRWTALLHKYLPGFTRPAVAVLGCAWLIGLCAMAWALWHLMMAPATPWLHVALGLAGVAAATLFPLKVPGSTYTITTADTFVFMVLATLGVPAAVLAAGVEGLVGGWRLKYGPAGRVNAPLVAMLGALGGGLCFELIRDAPWLQFIGMASATLAALCLAAPVKVLLNSAPRLLLNKILRRAQEQREQQRIALSLGTAIMVASAALAGLLTLEALRFGPALVAVTGLVTLIVVALLRYALGLVETERQKQESTIAAAREESRLTQERFASAFTHAAIGMAIVRADGRVLRVNAALAALVDRAEAALLEQPFERLLHPGDEAAFTHRARAVLADPAAAFSMELRCLRGDGDVRWVAVHCSSTVDPAGQGPCLIYQLLDITSRHVAEWQLQHIAYHDSLTNLANRHCFQSRLAATVERSRVDAEQRFAVLYLDLDRFKLVNDSMGHMAGNELLREVAQRILRCVRSKDLVARLGGDEFAILLEGLHEFGHARQLAARLLNDLAVPVQIGGSEVVPGASIGITLSDLGYRTADEVLRDADLAMYEAKAGGRGRAVVFDISMHERLTDRMALEADLRRAIAARQITLHFQPLCDLTSGRINAFEALARWEHPQRGPISPAVFVELAEECGHMPALTSAVLELAVAQLAAWRRAHPGTAALGMHVNISSQDLMRPDLAGEVAAVLQRHGVPADRLTLEITETMLMSKLDVAMGTLTRLVQAGVRFSIDDFGTGYSSLAYLSTLPFDSLKIDRSFVQGLDRGASNVEIVRAIVTLAKSLGRKVVAEGIETEQQLQLLRQLDVDEGQGYLLSRPVPAAAAAQLLNTPMAILA
jgi:diguanylate cyclase (GGDEF)-like protein/PAS domain S-box-containing protein